MNRFLIGAAAAALLAGPVAAQGLVKGANTDHPMDQASAPAVNDAPAAMPGDAMGMDQGADPAVADSMGPARPAEGAASDVSAVEPQVVTRTITNGPVPDTRVNRERFGGPMSRAGKATIPHGD